MQSTATSLETLFGVDVPSALARRAGDLAVAAEAALRGGRAALEHYGSDDLAVRDKGEDDPVTAADHASNREILAVLSDRRPGDALLSEESLDRPRAAGTERLWVIDPLDGTKEFLARNGEFSVMVGLAVDGAAVLGAVYQADPDRLFLGVADGGAWSVDSAQHDPSPRALSADGGEDGREEGPIRFVRSRSHPDERLRELESALSDREIVLSGSVGIKCALIAAGAADLYVHPVPYLKEWDTCAPEAVLRGAGGRVTDCAGRPLTYGKPDPRQPHGIFAARPRVWEEVAPTVRRIAADIL